MSYIGQGTLKKMNNFSFEQGRNLKASFVHLYPYIPWRSPRIDCWGDCVCSICLKKREDKIKLMRKVARDGLDKSHSIIIHVLLPCKFIFKHNIIRDAVIVKWAVMQ